MGDKPLMQGRLVLIGAGKMGSAMLAGWLDHGVRADQVTIFDPAPPRETLQLIDTHAIQHNPDPATVEDVEAILVAIKPQMVDAVLPDMADLARGRPLVVSVVAGKTISSFHDHFGEDVPVVRTIPNTPAAVGRGITAMAAGPGVSAGQLRLAEALLQSIGKVVTVDDEALIDAVTAVSGSGPAYVFHLTECLASAGRKLGLPDEIAVELARETVAGAGELMYRSGLDAATLRENVTSPNGTTFAALQVLMGDQGLEELMQRAVSAAHKRSRELAG